MDYLKLTFSKVDQTKQEMIIAKLSEFAFIGFEQKEQHLLAYAENSAMVHEDYTVAIQGIDYTHEIIPEVNWNEKWERDFEPIIIKDQVAIRAHFHKAIPSVQHEIIVTPKMSFGTGHHATTQLMMEQMGKINFKEKKVFDYGTGTGVLAIYAKMLGAKEIIANDIDPWSEENAKENAERNGCTQIDIRLGGLEVVSESGFNCILANINLNVLKASMEGLFSKLIKGSSDLILSGVLVDHQEDIVEVVKLYSVDFQAITKGKWLCIHVKY